MNVRSLSRALVSSSLALSLSACAVTPSDAPSDAPQAEHDGATSSAMLIVPPPGVLTLTPMSLCSTTTADVTTGYPAEPGLLEQGTSNANDSCDYFVTEVDGVQGKDITLAIMADPQITVSEASCEASTETFATFGYVPTHFSVLPGGGVQYYPAQWESIAQQTIHGVYVGPQAPASGEGDCAFNAWVEPSSATGTANAEIQDSPYSIIRVATQAVYTNGTTTWRGTMGTYVVPKP